MVCNTGKARRSAYMDCAVVHVVLIPAQVHVRQLDTSTSQKKVQSAALHTVKKAVYQVSNYPGILCRIACWLCTCDHALKGVSSGQSVGMWPSPEVDVALDLVDLGLDASLLQQALHIQLRASQMSFLEVIPSVS